MNSTKKITLLLLFISLICLIFSWKALNVGLLFASACFFSIAIMVFCKKSYILTAVVVFLSLALAEFLLPMFNKSSAPSAIIETYNRYKSAGKDGYFSRIPGFGHIPLSGVHTSKNTISGGEVIYDVTYTIGEDGYRDSKIPEPFDNFLFGGSYAFGEGLNDDETLPYYLWSEHSIKVKNVAFSGYGLHQALYNIQENAVTAKGGINILLTAPWHALRSACKPSYSRGTPKYVVVDSYAELDGTCQGDNTASRILDHSNIYKLVKKVLTRNSGKISDADIELYLAIVRSIKRETAKNNSKLMIAFIATSEEAMKFTRYSNKMLAEELASLSDFFVDVSLPGEGYRIHERDGHPNAEANRKRAEQISNKHISAF